MDPKKKKLIVGIVLVVILVGGFFVYRSFQYVTTDNAMIQAPTMLLSSKVSGIIVHADVQENQKVKAGQLLAEIKPDDYQNALAQAESERDSLTAQAKNAETSFQRTSQLLKKGASTQERYEISQAQYLSSQSKLKAAEAQLTQARLNLEYTKIVAPSDGKIGRRSCEVGMLASTGQPLMGFVSGNERWVVANLKETDMAQVSEGKKAFIKVDAVPGKEFEGTVESISPTTGATFSLLPPDNATGNFTKVVQRVPIRIKLLNLSEKEIDRLQAGLSAEVKVQVR